MLDIMNKIYEYKIEYSFGENYLSKLNNFDVIFRAPSCRPDLPEIQKEEQPTHSHRNQRNKGHQRRYSGV